jgi:hypothetical protein
MKVYEHDPMDCIHNLSSFSKLMNGPNKLEYYITLGQKGL